MKTYYKVTKDLKSIVVNDKLSYLMGKFISPIEYKINKFVYSSPNHPMMVFDDKYAALKFAESQRLGDYYSDIEVYSCDIQYIFVGNYDNKMPTPYFFNGWPEGTVFCNGVKLLEKVG